MDTPPPPLAPETATRLTQKVGSGDALLAAVLAGLVIHPQALARHSETLARIHPTHPDMAALLDTLLVFSESGEPLESAALRPILEARQLRLPTADDYDGLRFGFLSGQSATALDELAEAIELIVELPAVELALTQATERFETEISDESFAEQQRLLQRRLALLARLGQMGRTRASL
jgi:DNA primase